MVISVGRLMFAVALLPLGALAENPRSPALTPAPNGPYRVVGNRILDKQDRPYLIRGTRLAPLTSDPADEKGSADAFGALSATSLITIRQRLNMNAVRLPVSAADFEANAGYRARVERLVRLANRFELLVILETSEPEPANESSAARLFWARAAALFKDNPNIFFAPLSPSLVAAIRQSGARQPVVVETPENAPLADPAIIYQATPSYTAARTDLDRQRQFGAAAAAVPLLVNGLDPDFDRASPECAAFPSDPEEATQLVHANLVYFDAQQISWTLSSFTAGHLITDYRYFNGTKLDAGWTCGKRDELPAGLGVILLSHLWNATPLGLFTVSESRGGLTIARGGVSTAYGPILADEAMEGKGPPFPTALGNVSIRVTDSRGTARLAQLFHTGAGWAFLSFLIPADCATGPAEVAVVRTDGSISKSKVLIADLAPGLFTNLPDGRSEAVGEVTQHKAGAPDRSFPVSECGESGCHGLPIPLSPGVSTTVRLYGTGFRYSGDRPDVKVTVGGNPAPVLAMGATSGPGGDQLTIKLPDTLEGVGETDLYFTVNGQLSNVVRINLGSGR